MDVSNSVWYHMDVELGSGILYKQKIVDLIQAFAVFNMASSGLRKMMFPPVLLSGILFSVIL